MRGSMVASWRSRTARGVRGRIAGTQAVADLGYQRTKSSRLDALTTRETIRDQSLQLMVQELSQHGRLIGDGVRQGILQRQWPLPPVRVAGGAEGERWRLGRLVGQPAGA